MFYILAIVIGNVDLIIVPFHTSVTDLNLAWGSQCQRKAKSLGFIFLLQDEILYGVEAILFLIEI